MIGRHVLFTAAVTAVLLISTSAYAGGGMGGGAGMMGGQGHGMMGGGGNDMMGAAPNHSNPWTSPQSGRSATDLEKRLERDQLREEIRKKRQALSELYNADKPDKALIDQKISELHAIEADYDRSIFDAQ
jgi:Spy/CpxP family protein refolding chaperone